MSILKHKLSKRILVALVLIGVALVWFMPAASANSSLDNALSQLNPDTNTLVLNLEDMGIYGDVDVQADLLAVYPDVQYIFLDSNNITDVQNIPTTNPSGEPLTVTYTDTFCRGPRSFVYDGGTVSFYESADADLDVADLIDLVKIQKTDGTTDGVPLEMLDAGTVSITVGSTTHTFNVDPNDPTNDTIDKDDILALPSGVHDVALDFPVAESTSATLTEVVKLEVKKAGYILTPALGSVYDGGAVDFTLTKTDENGTLLPIGSEDDYNVYLNVNAVHNLQSTTQVSADGMSLVIRIQASALGDSTSVDVEVYDATDTAMSDLLATSQLTKFSNADISGLRLREYPYDAVDGDWVLTDQYANSGDRLHIAGGTSISSTSATRLTQYTHSTMYLLVDGSYNSVPARYESQVSVTIGDESPGVPYNLAYEIVAVNNPYGGTPGNDDDQVLAVVISSTSATAGQYTASAPGASDVPITIELNNATATNPVVELNADVIQGNVTGYAIYQMPQSYSSFSKVALEGVINGSGYGIELVGRYSVSDGKTLVAEEVNGVYLAADSDAYLVATVCYQDSGQQFLAPQSSIVGWYYDMQDSGTMFDTGSINSIQVGTTSVYAYVEDNSLVPVAGDTNTLRLTTGSYNAPEDDGKLVFAPNGMANDVQFPLYKVEQATERYLIFPSGYTYPAGTNSYSGALAEEVMLYNINGSVGDLYKLNVLGEDTIPIGGTNTYGIVEMFNDGREAVIATDAATDVTLNPASDPLSVRTSTVISSAEYYDVVATANGGGGNSLAGTTVDMVYSDGTVNSATVTLTLIDSEANGLYIVLEDYLGNLYSYDAALYTYFANIDTLTDNFQIPEGTTANVYAVYGFANSDFYSGIADWRDYIVDTQYLTVTATPTSLGSITVGGAVYPYESLALDGIIQSGGNGIVIEAALDPSGPSQITVGANTYEIDLNATSDTDTVADVIEPLVEDIEAEDSLNATGTIGGGSTVTGKVGDNFDTDPVVSLTNGNTGINAAVSSADYRGEITMQVSSPYHLWVDDYELWLANETDPTNLPEVTYTYTYAINGVDVIDQVLPETGTTIDYSYLVEVLKPTVEAIYLVAEDNSTLTWHGDTFAIATPSPLLASENVYTLPYAQLSTVRVYPVALSSRYYLDTNGYTPSSDAAIDPDDVANYPDYYSYLHEDDFDISWNAPTGATGGFYTGQAGVDSVTGYHYYEFQFTSAIDYADALQLLLDTAESGASGDVTILTGAAGTFDDSYSDYLATGNVDVTIFHMMDKDTAYVNNIRSTVNAPGTLGGTIRAGDGVPVSVEYYVSSELPSNGQLDYYVHPSYFDTDTYTIMPGSELYDENQPNALKMVQTKGPAVDFIYDDNSGDLIFYPTVAGEYEFQLSSVNNAGNTVPTTGSDHLFGFTVSPSDTPLTLYWGQPQVLPLDAAVDSWAETGRSSLDATALASGVLEMANNADGATTVMLYDASGTPIGQLNVTLVSATVSSVSLSETTSHTNRKQLVGGETFPLYWIVEYAPSDLTVSYYINEEIDPTTWTEKYSESSNSVALNGSLAEAQAGTANGMVFYGAVHATGKSADFWADIDVTARPTPYNYSVVDGAGNPVTQVNLNPGGSETLFVVDGSGIPVTGLALVTSVNTLVALPSGCGSDSNAFTAIGASVGATTVTVYPVEGGSVSIDVAVDPYGGGGGTTYTVTYNANGGRGAKSETAADGTSYTVLSQSATGITRSGYTFTGWNTAADGSGTTYVAGDVISSVTENVTLYAQWTSSNSGSGGGGGGGTVTNYSVTVDAGSGGSASASHTTATSGTTITVTVTPDEGQEIASVTVADAEGNPVALHEGANGVYTFTMPTANVTVTVTFTEEGGKDTEDPEHNCPSEKFTDVDTSEWYHEYIDYVLDNDIMNGITDTTFEPDTELTRAMMVQILYNMEGRPAVSDSRMTFNDVTASNWCYNAVAWASASDIVEGYDENTYGPLDNVTREQMATILYRYAKSKGYDTDATAGLSSFIDANSVGSWAQEAMNWAVGAGLIEGRTTTTLVPEDTATRAEVATIMTRFCEYYSIF